MGYDMAATYPPHVELRHDVRPALPLLGVGGARRATADLANPQPLDYVVQLDAHMRAEPNWDRELVRTLDKLPAKSIVTGALPASPWDQQPGHISVGQVRPMDSNGWPSQFQGYMVEGRAYPARVVYAGSLGGRAWTLDCPVDPLIAFNGEQPVLAARLWTSGYNLFHAPLFISHGSIRPPGRPWEHPSWAAMNEIGLRRCRAILQQDTLAADDPAGDGIEHYGLGQARSWEFWLEYSKFDYQPGAVVPHWGEWPNPTPAGGCP